MVTSSGTSYSYDGNSLRVKKVSGATTTVYIFSGTKVIAEYVNSSLGKEYIYSGSGLLATIESGTTKYHHGDHLSVRVTTDTSGNVVAQQAHYPFGESWYQGSGGTKWQFTSYERDAESGNDYAVFRYHINRLGRFSSPDPIADAIGDPQSLNRYSYVRNDPADLIDPSGLRCVVWFNYVRWGGIPDVIPGGWVLASVDTLCFADPVPPDERPTRQRRDQGDKPQPPTPRPPSRTIEVNRCAAELANTLSISALTGTQNVPIVGTALSNSVSSVSQLAFGPDRPKGARGSAVTTGAGPVLQKSAQAAGGIEVNRGFQSLFTTIAPTTLGRTAVGSVAVNLLEGVGSFLGAIFRPQLVYDTGVYVGALVVCAQQ